MQWYAADFETSNSKINIEQKYTRVWAWDIFDPITREHLTGYNIETFFDTLFDMPSCILYFHNLKFDGAFILYYLLENGFEINDTKRHGTISTLITDRLIWYTATIYYCGKKYVLRDSMKKITGSLEKAAVAFDLPIKKGSIDYQLHRDEGYIPTQEELDYIHNDTEILADVLLYYYENGMTGLTNATDAMKAFKKIIGDAEYKNDFPSLPKEVDDFIRRSYKGGFCYLNPIHFNEDLGKVYTYDVKSMYPSVMKYSELPFGVPVHYIGQYQFDENRPLFIQEINVDCKLKEGYIPSIQSKSFMSTKLNYLTDTHGKMQNMVLTSVDLELLLTDYDIYEIEFIQGWRFRSRRGLFSEYIDHYFALKESSKGAKKQLYKIFLNSLYGKFAMMMERTKAEPRIENNQLKYKKLDPEEVDSMYTAVASFITANARKKLLDGIYANKDNFVYCDTDSIHLLAPAHDIKLGKELGDFDLENGYYENGKPITEVNRARYLGQKCYILCKMKNGNEIEIKKIAGAPDKVKEQINMDNFRINFQSNADAYPKFRIVNVKGGVVLVPTTFTIKAKV